EINQIKISKYHDNSPLRGFKSQIAINPPGSRRSGLSRQTKAMEGSSEPAKPWFSAAMSNHQSQS
ncbi:hypothetical protein NP036_11035, partial [Weissella confusa]|nr:hypothetical protein [Weissella confusa]